MKLTHRSFLRDVITLMLICLTSPHLLALSPGIEQKLADLRTAYETAYKNEVGVPYEQAAKDLTEKYLAALERALAVATQSGDLDSALALRDERTRLAANAPLPLDDSQAVPALLPLRQTYRGALVGLETARSTKAAPLQNRYLQALEALQAQLTQAGELDGALAVKQVSESFRKETLPPSATPTMPTQLGKAPPADTTLVGVSKERPFVNTLNMRFVPVPGTNVLFCIHETRRRDYSAYDMETPDVDKTWKGVVINGYALPQDLVPNHPVRSVSWHDAKAFCEWLSKKEGKIYRLPTDREWSIAVGIGGKETWKPGVTPQTLDKGSLHLYPWGNRFPPPAGAGNYSDESRREQAPINNGDLYIKGYNDGFPTTAPVMSFAPNAFGLFDMSGNVWEWVEDCYSEAMDKRVIRGSSWHSYLEGHLRLSKRGSPIPSDRNSSHGFRIVLEGHP